MRKFIMVLLALGSYAGLDVADPALAVGVPAGPDRPQVRIIAGPALERATDGWAIIRWTTNNVKGTSLRYGVVHYGTDPHDLSQTAKSPNRWNPGLPTMIYRVQLNHLEPATTYYYRVESANALGASEGPESAVGRFATKSAP